MLQLLTSEVAIFEGLKAGKTATQIAKELGGKKGHTNSRVLRMLELGFITREGSPKRYVYHVSDEPYEVVEKREAEVMPEDTRVNKMVEFTLSEDKIRFLKANYLTLTRSELSKKLGVGKLELSYVMHKLDLKQKENKAEGVS